MEKRQARFVVLSALVHILLLLLIWKVPVWFPSLVQNLTHQHDQGKTVNIEIVSPPENKVAREERIHKNQNPKNQIVETTKVKKAKEAAPDAYLGEQTQTVDRETRSKTVAPFQEPKLGQSVPSPEQKPGQQNSAEKQNLKIGKLGIPMNMRPLGGLSPAERMLQSKPGVSGATNDYLDDRVADGAQTMLNTKEFAYFSYYQRVRRQLEQFWEPKLRSNLKKMFSRGRSVANNKDHSTRLLVVMDNEGSIRRIQVENTSGYFDLDDAAIQAFNKAGPFPNPPRGLVEKDGTVKIEWEFVLKT